MLTMNNMRKVILSVQVSLDGFTAGPNGELDWLVEHVVSEEGWNSLNDLVSTVDTALLGRVNYQGFASYWPAMATNPSSTKNDIEFSRWLDTTPKLVFSRTLEQVEWKNARLVKENIAEEIRSLKQQEGQDMVILHSASLAQTFMQLGLIDEYRLSVHPVVLGGGILLFKDIKDRMNLKLVEAKTFRSGVVLLSYQSIKE
jgi:dihydrofolate reductase